MLQMLAVLFLVTLVCVNIHQTRIRFHTRPLEIKEILLTWQHLLKQQVQDDTRADFRMHFIFVLSVFFNQLVITAFFSPQPFSAFSSVSARKRIQSTFTFFSAWKKGPMANWLHGRTDEINS